MAVIKLFMSNYARDLMTEFKITLIISIGKLKPIAKHI
jgi:hypothetical protein